MWQIHGTISSFKKNYPSWIIFEDFRGYRPPVYAQLIFLGISLYLCLRNSSTYLKKKQCQRGQKKLAEFSENQQFFFAKNLLPNRQQNAKIWKILTPWTLKIRAFVCIEYWPPGAKRQMFEKIKFAWGAQLIKGKLKIIPENLGGSSYFQDRSSQSKVMSEKQKVNESLVCRPNLGNLSRVKIKEALEKAEI